MTKYFYKTTEMNGSPYVKIPLRSWAILIFENDDKFCFFWSILASLHLFQNSQPDRVSNYRQYFDEINIQGFDFTNGFRCSDVHIFEKWNTLSINIIELSSYPDQNNWKKKVLISKLAKTIQIELLIYWLKKSLVSLNKKTFLFEKLRL